MTATDTETISHAAERAASECAGREVRADNESAAMVKHGVTTRKITLYGVLCKPSGTSPREISPDQNPTHAWAAPEELGTKYPLSSPQAKLLQKILGHDDQLSLF